jgi:hypothetical protein
LRIRSIGPVWRLSGAAFIATWVLTGCASESDLARRSQIAPDSPVAMAIAEVQAHPSPYPSFADFPKTPTGMRLPVAWEEGRHQLAVAGDELAKISAAPAEMPDPAAFARQLRAASGLDQVPVPGPDAAAELEAYARELRERATPPPPPQ